MLAASLTAVVEVMALAELFGGREQTQERWVEKLAAVKLNRGVFNRGCSKKNVSFLKKYITSAASLVKATPQKKNQIFEKGECRVTRVTRQERGQRN